MAHDTHTRGMPTPSAMLADYHGPILELLHDTFITPAELAERWRQHRRR